MTNEEQAKETRIAATIFVIVGIILLIVIAVKLPQKLQREERQDNATLKIESMQEQINQLKDTMSTKATIAYVNSVTVETQKQVEDKLHTFEVKTYEPTADCIEVEMQTPKSIRLDCIKR